MPRRGNLEVIIMSEFTSNHIQTKQPMWQTVAAVSLGFWLSSCLLLDLVIMPTMYGAGMMAEPGFASAGYSIFSAFNRIELVCAALVLTGLLVTVKMQSPVSGNWGRWAVLAAVMLLGIVCVDTYGLTPQMSALGMQLNLFDAATEVPVAMDRMHESYWVLEVMKVLGGGMVLYWFSRLQQLAAE